MSKRACDTYARLLLPKGYGFPLWIPEPDDRLPLEYRSKGVRIGDVGIISSDGAFDFLFNVCAPRDDAINAYHGVPEDFEQLLFNERTSIIERRTQHARNSHIATANVTRHQLEISTSIGENSAIPAGFGGGVQFNCTSSEGAILMMPHGGSHQRVANLADFRQYALCHGLSWYKYVNGHLRREASNGSICLVTGCHKVQSWVVSAFSDVADDQGISLSITAASIAQGAISYTYSSETHSLPETRVGPDCITNDLPQNQCVFVSGFLVKVRDGVMKQIMRGKPKLEPIDASKSKGKPPFSTLRSSPATSPEEGSSNRSNDRVDSDPSLVERSVDAEHLPKATELCHPADLINSLLFEWTPSSMIAVTHDSDWIPLLNELAVNDTMPSDQELITCFRRTFNPCVVDGDGVYAVKIDDTAPHHDQGVLPDLGVEKVEEESVATDPSVSFAAASLTRIFPSLMVTSPEDLVLLWTGQDPRNSVLFTSQGTLYRFQTDTSQNGQSITSVYSARSANRELRVARLNWAPNGGLGTLIIGKSYMSDMLRLQDGGRVFNGPDGRQYRWTPGPNRSDIVLQDTDRNTIAFFRPQRPTRYPMGDVYGELHLCPRAGAGTATHPPMMDAIVVSAMLCRISAMFNF